jgi:hypothetical protein
MLTHSSPVAPRTPDGQGAGSEGDDARGGGEVLSLYVCSRMLTYAHVCQRRWRGAFSLRMLAYAHVCSRMPEEVARCFLFTYARVCSRMLTYAHVCQRRWRGAFSLRMLAYAHVCSRMHAGTSGDGCERKRRGARLCAHTLTYADVCCSYVICMPPYQKFVLCY